MPAYKVILPNRVCTQCHKPAKYEVFNTFNAKCGDYCERHAKLKVEDLNKGHRIQTDA